MCAKQLKSWELITSRQVFAAESWIKVSVEQVRLPDGRVIGDYHHVKMADYAAVFAETVDGKVIVERQYKHGIGSVSLVMPAGSIEKDEIPLKAAQRELLEETGYAAEQWQSMGSFVVHGNYGCCRGHFFRARGAQKVAEANSKDLEEMEIVLCDLKDIVAAVRTGEVVSLGSAALIAMATNPLVSQDG